MATKGSEQFHIRYALGLGKRNTFTISVSSRRLLKPESASEFLEYPHSGLDWCVDMYS